MKGLDCSVRSTSIRVRALARIWIATLLMTCAVAATASAEIAPRPPNIIVILADDLGYADISAYKVGRFKTPNIDRIGLEGVRFTDGYVTAPCADPRARVCKPGATRSALALNTTMVPRAAISSRGSALPLVKSQSPMRWRVAATTLG